MQQIQGNKCRWFAVERELRHVAWRPLMDILKAVWAPKASWDSPLLGAMVVGRAYPRCGWTSSLSAGDELFLIKRGSRWLIFKRGWFPMIIVRGRSTTRWYQIWCQWLSLSLWNSPIPNLIDVYFSPSCGLFLPVCMAGSWTTELFSGGVSWACGNISCRLITSYVVWFLLLIVCHRSACPSLTIINWNNH